MRFGTGLGPKLLALSMLLSVQAPAAMEKQYPNIEDTNRVAASLISVLGGCPDKIWPGLKLSKLDVLLVNKELPRQILVSTMNKTITTIPNEELPPHVFQAAYSKIPYQGREILYVDSQYGLSGSIKRSITFGLAVHESFHMVDQRQWVQKRGARGTTLPLLASPRVARAMLYRNLVNVLKDKRNSAESLGKARFWYDEWLKADATEGVTTADGYEGTAMYVETIASLYDQRSCGATESELEQLSFSTPVSNGSEAVGFSGLDSEGYFVGGMASLILRFRYPQLNWQALVATGENPLQTLMKNVVPVADQADERLKSRIEQHVAKRSEQVEKFVAPARQAMSKDNAVYVAVPSSSMRTSFSPKGFFNDREGGVRYIPMAEPLDFQLTQGARLRALEGSVFVEFEDSAPPCDDYGWQFVLESSEVVQSAQGQFTIDTKHFKGLVNGKVKLDSQNRQWICVQP
ncbi:hypothetical protein [Bdellovibrio sp. HCB209]|uniref:hypothetical protein n=1 Tax=Bdellovibrio sp. HCB209 TaxID=3394354 RepID=UPI0039B39E48